jgi:hypothetical protein
MTGLEGKGGLAGWRFVIYYNIFMDMQLKGSDGSLSSKAPEPWWLA